MENVNYANIANNLLGDELSCKDFTIKYEKYAREIENNIFKTITEIK